MREAEVCGTVGKQKKDEATIRTIVNLPNGNGKKVRVAVLCEESKNKEAKDSGADLSGSETLINDITSGKLNFDWSTKEFSINSKESRIEFLNEVRSYVKNTSSCNPNQFADELSSIFSLLFAL